MSVKVRTQIRRPKSNDSRSTLTDYLLNFQLDWPFGNEELCLWEGWWKRCWFDSTSWSTLVSTSMCFGAWLLFLWELLQHYSQYRHIEHYTSNLDLPRGRAVSSLLQIASIAPSGLPITEQLQPIRTSQLIFGAKSLNSGRPVCFTN